MPDTGSVEVSLERLLEHPFRRVIAYPHPTPELVKERVEELSKLGVTALIPGGATQIDGVNVLGKGQVGVVTRCSWRGKPAALKIRRTDADRESLEDEAKVMTVANSKKVGPILFAYSSNFIVMEEVRGKKLVDWLQECSSIPDLEFRRTLRSVCEQGRLLDEAGIDHRELSDPRRHVVLKEGSEACVLDFETAGVTLRKRNVTRLVQYITMARPFGRVVLSRLGADEFEVLRALRAYKEDPSRESFLALIEAMKLS